MPLFAAFLETWSAKRRISEMPEALLHKHGARAHILSDVLKRQVPGVVPGDLGVRSVRELCLNGLDIPLAHHIRMLDRSRFTLSRQELVQHAERRVAAMRAREELLCMHRSSPDPVAGADLGVAFWLDVQGPWPRAGSQSLARPPVFLPDTAVVGLRSAVAVGGLDVVLFVYQDIANLPEGVCLSPAASLLDSRVAREHLKQGMHVAHLSDVVRMSAIAETSRPAWFVDCDTVWLRHATWAVADLPPPAGGHFVGSCARPPSARGMTSEAFERRCALHYLATPRDALAIQPPLRLPAWSPVAGAFLAEAYRYYPQLNGRSSAQPLQGRAHSLWYPPTDKPSAGVSPSKPHASVHYNVLMDVLESLVVRFGLEFAVAEWCVVAPLHRHLGERPYRAHGLDQVDERLDQALCVTNFMQSSRHMDGKKATALRLGSARWAPESAWQKVCDLAIHGGLGRAPADVPNSAPSPVRGAASQESCDAPEAQLLPTSSRRRLHRVTPALAELVSELERSQHDGTVAVGTEITGVAAEVSSTVSVGSQTVEANEAVLVQDMVDVWSAPGFMNTAAATVVFELLTPQWQQLLRRAARSQR